jgi:hypothetical protein
MTKASEKQIAEHKEDRQDFKCTATAERLRNDLRFYMDQYAAEISTPFVEGRWKQFMKHFRESLAVSLPDPHMEPTAADLLPVFGDYASSLASTLSTKKPSEDILELLLPASNLIIADAQPGARFILNLDSAISVELPVGIDIPIHDLIESSLATAAEREQLSGWTATPSGVWEEQIKSVWNDVCASRPDVQSGICHPFQLVLRRMQARRYFTTVICNRLTASNGTKTTGTDASARKTPREVINEKRIKKGWSWSDLSKRHGMIKIDADTVRRICDSRPTHPDSRRRLAELIEVSPADLEPLPGRHTRQIAEG